MHDVKIRSARAEDATAIAELTRQLGYPSEAGVMGPRLAAVVAEGDEVLVAVDDGDIPIGWIQMSVVTALESGAFAEIRGLVVDEPRRSAGIGAALVAAGEAWARARSMRRIRVRSNVVRERTHRFYERLGYTGVKSQRVFDKPLTAS